MTPNPLYLVTSFTRTSEHVWDADLQDMDRKTVVRDIAGCQFPNVTRVLEMDLIAGTLKDVTKEIAWEVSQRLDDEGEPLNAMLFDFIEQHLGVIVAQNFARAA